MTKQEIASHVAMKFNDYFVKQPRGARSEMAKALGIGRSFFSQLSRGDANISPARAVEIERLSGGGISRKDLLPTKWQDIWPEAPKKES